MGKVVPITTGVAMEWARYALVTAPQAGYDPDGSWFPTRSLVCKWFRNAQDPGSLSDERFFYKANDAGAFDLAMPINVGQNMLPKIQDFGDMKPQSDYVPTTYAEPIDDFLHFF